MNLSFSEEFNGKPQYFIRKIWISLAPEIQHSAFNRYALTYRSRFNADFSSPNNGTGELKPKIHTIRRFRTNIAGIKADRQWKKGMAIHLSINPGRPDYFRFAPLILCLAVQHIEIKWSALDVIRFPQISIDKRTLSRQEIDTLATNDGFDSTAAFLTYFDKDFSGTLIHWTNFSY